VTSFRPPSALTLAEGFSYHDGVLLVVTTEFAMRDALSVASHPLHTIHSSTRVLDKESHLYTNRSSGAARFVHKHWLCQALLSVLILLLTSNGKLWKSHISQSLSNYFIVGNTDISFASVIPGTCNASPDPFCQPAFPGLGFSLIWGNLILCLALGLSEQTSPS
jgi:hypothetical protein